MHNFFAVFWLVHSVSEVLSVWKILDGGVTPSPRLWRKNGSAAKPILRQDVGRRPADTAAQLLTSVAYHISHAAQR